jgi:hypothetical protein
MVAWGKVARLVWRYAKHKSVTLVGWEEAPVRMVAVRSYVRTLLPAAAHTVLPAACISLVEERQETRERGRAPG